MDSNILREMTIKAREDLININKYSAKAMVKDTLKKLAGRSTTNRDMLFWPAGLLLHGLSEVCDVLPEKDPLKAETMKDIKNYIDTWAEAADESFSYVDDSLSGMTMLMLFKASGDNTYLKYAGKLYEYLCSYKKTTDGSTIYNASAGNDYVFADGAGQIAMFLFRFAADTKSSEAFLKGAKELTNFYTYGFDARSALPYHAFSGESKEKLGLLGWGRACGWLLMGYAECLPLLREFSSDIYSEEVRDTCRVLAEQYLLICHTVLSYLRPDGGFAWHIPSVEGKADTSAAAMIGYAFAKGIMADIFTDDTEEYKKAAIGVRDFLIAHTENGSVNNSLSGCEDLAVHRQIYGHYPWGQGTTLAFMSLITSKDQLTITTDR